MIETYKIMQGMDKVDRVKTDKIKYFFTQHVVSLWNSLPQDVVMASGLEAF